MICDYGQVREIGTTADVGLIVRAKELASLFSAAAWGMSALIADINNIGHDESAVIELHGDDPEMVMVDWLSELLFIFSVRHILYTKYDTIWTGNGICSRAAGSRMEGRSISFRHDVKGVTWHGLKIRKTRHVYQARILFDV